MIDYAINDWINFYELWTVSQIHENYEARLPISDKEKKYFDSKKICHISKLFWLKTSRSEILSHVCTLS